MPLIRDTLKTKWGKKDSKEHKMQKFNLNFMWVINVTVVFISNFGVVVAYDL